MNKHALFLLLLVNVVSVMSAAQKVSSQAVLDLIRKIDPRVHTLSGGNAHINSQRNGCWYVDTVLSTNEGVACVSVLFSLQNKPELSPGRWTDMACDHLPKGSKVEVQSDGTILFDSGVLMEPSQLAATTSTLPEPLEQKLSSTD